MAIDLITNGVGAGSVANRMLQSGGDLGTLRPFLEDDGNSYVTINNGENTVPTANAATLRKDEWNTFDSVVIKAARQRLRAEHGGRTNCGGSQRAFGEPARPGGRRLSLGPSSAGARARAPLHARHRPFRNPGGVDGGPRAGAARLRQGDPGIRQHPAHDRPQPDGAGAGAADHLEMRLDARPGRVSRRAPGRLNHQGGGGGDLSADRGPGAAGLRRHGRIDRHAHRRRFRLGAGIAHFRWTGRGASPPDLPLGAPAGRRARPVAACSAAAGIAALPP